MNNLQHLRTCQTARVVTSWCLFATKAAKQRCGQPAYRLSKRAATCTSAVPSVPAACVRGSTPPGGFNTTPLAPGLHPAISGGKGSPVEHGPCTAGVGMGEAPAGVSRRRCEEPGFGAADSGRCASFPFRDMPAISALRPAGAPSRVRTYQALVVLGKQGSHNAGERCRQTCRRHRWMPWVCRSVRRPQTQQVCADEYTKGAATEEGCLLEGSSISATIAAVKAPPACRYQDRESAEQVTDAGDQRGCDDQCSRKHDSPGHQKRRKPPGSCRRH